MKIYFIIGIIIYNTIKIMSEICDLPRAILELVFALLPFVDFITVKSVCKSWYTMSNIPRLHSNYVITLTNDNIAKYCKYLNIYSGIKVKISRILLDKLLSNRYGIYRHNIYELDYDIYSSNGYMDILNQIHSINFTEYEYMMGPYSVFKFDGPHIITSSVGNVFEGIFKDNVLQEGKIITEFGNVFEGKFENHDLKEGKIIRKTDKGSITYHGTFTNDKLCGQGKIIYPDGTIIEGIFEDGSIISQKEPTHE